MYTEFTLASAIVANRGSSCSLQNNGKKFKKYSPKLTQLYHNYNLSCSQLQHL